MVLVLVPQMLRSFLRGVCAKKTGIEGQELEVNLVRPMSDLCAVTYVTWVFCL